MAVTITKEIEEAAKMELESLCISRQGICTRCGDAWMNNDGHGECFNWVLIDNLNRQLIMAKLFPDEVGAVQEWLSSK
jgi:hypothetical protein